MTKISVSEKAQEYFLKIIEKKPFMSYNMDNISFRGLNVKANVE